MARVRICTSHGFICPLDASSDNTVQFAYTYSATVLRKRPAHIEQVETSTQSTQGRMRYLTSSTPINNIPNPNCKVMQNQRLTVSYPKSKLMPQKFSFTVHDIKNLPISIPVPITSPLRKPLWNLYTQCALSAPPNKGGRIRTAE